MQNENIEYIKFYFDILNNSKLTSSEKIVLNFLANINASNLLKKIELTMDIIKQKTLVSNPYVVLNNLKLKGFLDYKKINRKYLISLTITIKNRNKWLKVYWNVFTYEGFTFSDILVYSYLLSLQKLKQNKEGIPITSLKIKEKINLSKRSIDGSLLKLIRLKILKRDNITKKIILL